MAEIKASLNNHNQSPRKTRLVADLVRGKTLTDALTDIKFTTKRASSAIEKLLKSAEKNASHNFGLSADKLRIKEIRVDKGMTMKRFMPRAFGKASRIRKRHSHITLVLESP